MSVGLSACLDRYLCMIIYIYTSVLLCIYMHKSGWTREVRGRMIRIIDVEYKRIRNISRKLIANPFSITIQTRSIGLKGSEVSTLAFVTQVYFVGGQVSQKMSARKSHGDGSDCSLCSLHDGDHRSLQVAQKRSLFGYKIHKINLSKALKTSLEMSQTAQKSPLEAPSGGVTPRDRFWTNFGPDFGRDFEVQIELRRDQKSSSRMHMLPRSLRNGFGTVLRSILRRFLSV